MPLYRSSIATLQVAHTSRYNLLCCNTAKASQQVYRM